MVNTPDLKPVLNFLDGLNQNNHKPWFEAQRPAYNTARSQFELFINGLIDELRLSDHLGAVSARDCIFRIYRDVRFSKDKSPYKTNMAALVAPGGGHSTWMGYYISLQPHGQSMVAGGLYKPAPDQLQRFRQSISRDADSFKEVTQAREFVEAFGPIEGERLKTAPKGYDPAHPDITLLQLKQITAMHPFSDEEVLAPDFTGQVINICRVLKPFLDYLAGVIS